MSVATLVALRAFVLAALSGVLLLPFSDNAAFAQSSPSVAVSLSPSGSVEQGTAITATMSFSNLEDDADTSTTDYIFRADVIGADECEGGGLGKTRYMYKVDEDPETRGATISTDCPAGDYTLRVSISSPDNVELASASAAFSVTEPEVVLEGRVIEFVPEGALASAQQAAQPTEPAVFGSISGGTVSLRWSDPGDGCTSKYQTYSRRYARWSALGRDLAPDTASWTNSFAILVWHPEGRTFGVWCNATFVESGSQPPGRKLGEVAFFGGDHAGNAPVAPGNVSITPRDGEIAVSWDAPANPSSSPIKNTIVQYQVQWKSGSEDYDANNRQAVTELPPALSHTVTGLTNGTEYTVRVRAVSTVHDGAWSSGTTATPAVSDDATLSSLTLTAPATDLDPAFDSATVSYNAEVSTGASSITVTVDTTDDGASYEVKLDGVADDDGTLSLTGAGPFTITIEVTAADGAATQTYTVTVTRTDPTVSIRADSVSVSEADGSATFTLTRNLDAASALTVAVTVSQQGDYLGTPIPVDAVFNARDRETTLTVPIVDDDLDEADGSVTATVTVAADAPYLAGSPAAAVVTVTDDDLPFVRLANVQIPTVTEGEFYRFRIERDGDTSVALSPRLTVISSGFNISEARPHAVDEGYVAAGVYVLLPGESSREFMIAGWSVGSFLYERLGALGGRRQLYITPDPAFYRTAELTEAHHANIDSCSLNVDHTDGSCLRGGIPTKPYLQFFVESSEPTVTIETAQQTVAEGAGVVVTLERHGGQTASLIRSLEVDLVVTESGTFIEGAAPATATFPPGQRRTTLTIPTENDEVDEVDGSITVEVTARTGGDYASTEKYLIVPDDAPAAQDFGERMVSVLVTDNDLPLITIAADAASVEEGEAASFTLTRTELANEAVSVTVDFTGTGNVLSGAASAVAAFALNARTAAVFVTTVDDDITEADGSLTATLRATTGYRVGAPATVIVEDDDLVIDLALSPIRVTEDGGGATVTVTAMLTSGERTVATVVDLTVSGSGVAGAVDFTPVTPFTLTIPPSATRGQATFRLTPLDDGVDETDETVTVSGAVAALPSLVVNAATLTLTDDDAASESIALSLDRTEVAENAGATMVTVTATLNASARTAATVVDLTVSGSGAADAVDFTPVQSFILTIPPNVTSGQARFTLTPMDDVVDEVNETVTVSGAVAATPTLTVHAAALTLTDDDEASDAIALSLSPAEVGEGAGAATVTVTATMNAGARTEPTELTVSVTGDTALAGTDFVEVNSFTLTVPANLKTGQETFTLTPTPDDIAEGDETITVSGEEIVDAAQMETALPVSPATLTLTDDDTASTRIDLSVDRLRFTETSPADTVTVTAILDGSSRTTETRVRVSVMGGTADAGDFAPVASFTLTIPATQTRGEATFTLEPLADNLLEGDETIVVSGAVTAGGTLPVTPVTITLADEFTASTEVTLRVKPTTVSERVGSRGQLVNVLAEMNAGARTAETVIRVTVSGSGTEEAVDFEPVQDFDLTIPANHTGGAATFTLAAVDDDVDEEDETITFSGAVAALPALTVNAATLTLTDDDDAADAITLSLDRTEIAEDGGATTVMVTATLNGNARTLATAVTVLVGGDAGDTATAGTDFTAVDSFTLTIPPNLKTGQETFTLTPLDDKEDEEDETIAVRGSVPALPAVTVNAATLTLTDNDERGMTVSPDTLTIVEGASNTYTVALATQPSADVTVTVTGASGTDLTVTGPPLTFTRANWSEPQTVTVAAGHDHDALADAVVTLTNTASGGDYGAVSAGVEVTIAEDDSPALALSKTELTVTEGDPSGGAYTVALATLPSANVTVTVTGASGTDLTVTGPPLTFTRANWSQTQTVTVTARHDDDALADAVVTLTNTASGADYGAVSAGVEVTIAEDDSPGLVLSTTGFSVTEGGAAGAYTVALATLPSAEVTVTVTGASGTDLTVVGSPLTFTTVDWDQPQTVTVTAALDVNRVADGTVTLTHTASGADYGAVSADITVTITRAISSDATLSGLELSGVTFTPTFAPGETTYEANALYSVASTKVTATPNHARATAVIKLDGTEDADRTVDLAVGANVITVEVTAEDGSDKTYTVTVTRAKATVTIAADASMADEGDALSFTVTRSPSAADALTVKLDVSETGTFVPPGNEGMKTVTIPANTPSAKHTVRIVAGDEVWDAHSTVTVALVAETDSPYTLGAANSASTEVKDNDFPTATAELAVNPNPATEGVAVTVTITVTTNSDQMPHEDGGTITLGTTDGSAAQTADYGALSATTFTLAQGDFSAVTVGGNSRYRAAYSATVGIVDDTTEEEDETFSVSMARGSDLDDRVTLGTPVSRTVTISANDAPTNNPPVFPSGTITRSVAENTGSGQNVGAPVAATDDDSGDTLTYSLEGTDGGSFTIVSTSGQIQTSAALNYEAKSSYSVTVKVNDGTVNATTSVTISVTDVDEPPDRPAAPTVTAKAGATDSLDVRWNAPGNTERPAIDDYNVQYRIGTTGPFTSHSFSGTGTSTTIAGLTAGTSYQVQVKAHNDEGDSPWSASGTGSTNAPTNNPPVFSSGTITRSVAENTASGQNVGAPVAATDDDSGDTLTYSLEGTDGGSFTIDSTSGQIQTSAALNYEAKSSYSVTVKVNDGTVNATTSVTISVTDVDEPPGTPDAPTVTAKAGATDSLDVSWTAPANTERPAIDDYNVQYRIGTTGPFTSYSFSGTGTSTTIAGLTAGTSYQVQVKAHNDEGDGAWSASGTGSTNAPTNNPPVFPSGTITRSVAENTASGQNVGAPVAATDDDAGDTLTYSLEGTDGGSFTIDSTSGQIQTSAALNYEAKSSYSVTVKVNDGTVNVTKAVTISVTDVDEPPDRPAAPTVTAKAGATDSLDVSWTAPANTERPAIDDYNVQYRIGTTGPFTSHSFSGTGTSTTITGLTAGTSYQVQVQAHNDEGDGAWSASGTGSTNAPTNNPPVFPSGTITRSVAENTGSGQNVGAPVAATDDDSGDTLTYSLEGTDGGSFTIVSTSGQIQTSAALNYEAKSSYSVTVKVNDGTVNATKEVTISVTDVDEPPGTPDAPTVTAKSGATDSLDVSWTAPANTERPAIDDYNVQYRIGTTGPFTSHSFSGTGTSTTITGLTAGTSYQVQVQAHNDEGDGAWSASGTGSTNAPTNNPPVFPSGTITRSVAENTASGQNVGAPVAATDDDSGDTLTYSLEGTDGGSFTIVRTSGQIQTSAALNYEAKISYSVTVKVNDGTVNVTKAVTISVTDVDEPPGTPDAPTVTAKSGATDSLDVSWSAPANAERPAIDDYNVQYRIGTTGPFTSHSFTGTGTSTTITGLTAGTSYQVQVQAHNDEGDSPWSASATASTNTATSTVSTDATLSDLSLSGVTFTPAFAPKTTSYRAIVGNSVSATTVTAVTTHDKATRKILIGGVQDLDADVDLAVGDNTITVEVTAEDGVATKTYTVAVTVARADESADGPNIVVAASKRVYDRKGGPDDGGYRERDLIIALYNLDSDATWSGDNYSGDFSTLDYVHRTDILDAGGSTDMADLERRNECEGPALFERNHIYMGVDREIRKVNENPETRGGGVIDTGDCANDFAVTVTVWSGADYQSQGRGAAPVAQLTCRFDGSANDDFAELDWEEQGDPGWYYQGYVLCTDADGDLAPDSAPTIPALNWEPPEYQ